MQRNVLYMVCLLAAVWLAVTPQTVQADEREDAHAYVKTYGNSVKFWKTGVQDGDIYYATGGKSSNAPVRFKTLGWQIVVRDEKGSCLQTIYCRLGGSSMRLVDNCTMGGYTYNLYSMSLSSLKSLLNHAAKKALEEGRCRITLNACMTVVVNGRAAGSMNMDGSTTGKVYTTYGGIVGAAAWSRAAKESLRSYFDKEVEGLFFDLILKRGTGIAEVSGGGHYLYGTKVTVSAKVSPGYTFEKWSGLHAGDTIESSFYVNRSGTMTAQARAVILRVVYHRNYSARDTMLSVQLLDYGRSGQCFYGANWRKDGKKPLGWALAPGAAEAGIRLGAAVSKSWILTHAPLVQLYAVWPGAQEDIDNPVPEPSLPTPSKPSEPSGSPTPSEPPVSPSLPKPSEPPVSPSLPKPSEDAGAEPGAPSDELLPSAAPIQMRFISAQYFENASGNLVARDKGGLNSWSRWAQDKMLRNLLRHILIITDKT